MTPPLCKLLLEVSFSLILWANVVLSHATANRKKFLNTKYDVSFGFDTCSLRIVTVKSLKWLYTTVIKKCPVIG